MQSLQSFKQSNGITELNFYPSKTSTRLISSAIISGKDTMIMTTKVFDKTKPIFVTPAEVTDEATGEVKGIIVLTNNEGKEPTMTL